jgi:hypothetical protein
MAKHHLYDESPAIERDEKGGTKVVKPTKKEIGPSSTEKGVKKEGVPEEKGVGMPDHVRHAMDRHHMHSKHEHEHAMHDAHGSGDKKEMHERHEKEMKEMHTRHEKEAGHDGGMEAGAGGAAGKKSEPIKKVEEGKKG